MKLVIITNNFPPILDGVGDHTFFLARQFYKLSHEVTIICKADINPINYPFSVLPIVKKWDQKNNKAILDEIKKIQPDRILLQYVPFAYHMSGVPFSIVALMRGIRSTGINSTVIFHEVAIRYNFKNPKQLIVAVLQRLIAFRLCKVVNRRVTSIDMYQHQLHKISGMKVEKVLIPPNFDTTIQVSEDDIKSIKEKISAGNVVIGLFGIRDAQFITQVFELIIARHPNITFLICGSNRLSVLDIPYTGQVHFTGILSQEQLPLYLSMCDVFWAADVCIEGKGGSSNKSGSLAAALFLGLPVVATKGDMNNTELITAENVHMEDFANAAGIADILLELANDSRTKVKKGDYWQKKLSWESIAKEYLNIIEHD